MREGTELLADEVAGPLTSDQKEVVAILDNSSRHLQQLIEQLLDYNRNWPMARRNTRTSSCATWSICGRRAQFAGAGEDDFHRNYAGGGNLLGRAYAINARAG